MDELVSVIMPSYNSAKFIGRSIESVQAQTYSNWELLIVDDCSTDDSAQIVRDYMSRDKRIKLLVNEKNGGAALSRNRALKEAEGKWIAFLDSDDLWLPQKLERQLNFMADGGYRFSYTKYEQIDENGERSGITVSAPGDLNKRLMSRCCYPGCLTVMYDAEEIGLIQIPDEIGNGENDYALWLKIIKTAECYYLDEILSQYRVVSSSLSHKSSKWRIIKNHYKMYRRSENKGRVASFFKTLKNVFYTFIKKKKYVRRAEGR